MRAVTATQGKEALHTCGLGDAGWSPVRKHLPEASRMEAWPLCSSAEDSSASGAEARPRAGAEPQAADHGEPQEPHAAWRGLKAAVCQTGAASDLDGPGSHVAVPAS